MTHLTQKDRLRPRFLLQMFLVFFRIGLFTFGGGYAMIPLIERTIIERKKWMAQDELLDILTIAQTMPGPIAVNAAALTGHRLSRRRGAVVAMLGCALPSVLVILVIAVFLQRVQNDPTVQHIFLGVRAAVTALILYAALRLGRRAIHDWPSLLIAVITVILVFFCDVHPLLTIIGGILLGMSLIRLAPAFSRRQIKTQIGESSTTENKTQSKGPVS